jgi:hypothetical protein
MRYPAQTRVPTDPCLDRQVLRLLVCAYDEHRAIGTAHDSLRDAWAEQAPECAPTVGPQNHHIGADLTRNIRDLLDRWTRSTQRGDATEKCTR